MILMFRILLLFLSILLIFPVYSKEEEFFTSAIVQKSHILKNQSLEDPCADGSCIASVRGLAETRPDTDRLRRQPHNIKFTLGPVCYLV